MDLLYKFNPWWEHEKWENFDEDLLKWNSMKLKWIPKWLKKISLKSFSLNFIVGPRQVGKTTGLKLLIKELLKNRNPFSVIYLNLEVFSDLKEFRETIERYIKIKQENKIAKSYLFFDEISKFENWHKIIKALIDLGVFKNDVIIASGSSSIGILKHAEAFTGRRGNGKTLKIMPLSFPEFLEIHGIEKEKLETEKEKIKKLFKEYVKYGGFPKSVNKINTFFDIISSIEREFENLGKNPRLLKQIIDIFFDVAPSAFSNNSIGNKIGSSHKTITEYFDILENLFIAKIVYWKDKVVNYRKEKKVFLRDPLLANSLASWVDKELKKDVIYEWVVQEHLFRKYGEINYYRNKYEIDCIAGNKKIEVKAGKTHRRYPKKVKIIEEEDIPFFLLELHKN